MDEKFVFNGLLIDKISVSAVTDKIFEMVEKGEKGYIVTPNAAHFLYLKNDREFNLAYGNAKLILPDGFSLILASRILRKSLKERCGGVEVFYSICRRLKKEKVRVFLLGGIEGSEKRTKGILLSENPDLDVGTYSPSYGFEKNPEETEKIVEVVSEFNPDILFLFLGSPKSEKFMYRYFERFNSTVALSLGSSLDYFSGRKERAPLWIRKIGFEWLYRLFKEPSRMWYRYLTGNSYFLYLIFKELISRQRFFP